MPMDKKAKKLYYKRPPETDNGDGTFSVDDIRFVKFGATRKFYLDIPTSIRVGCHCSNPDLWSNMLDKLTPTQKLVIPSGTTKTYYGTCDPCKRMQLETAARRNEVRRQKVAQIREAREAGETTLHCTKCPDGVQSKFTKKKDGTTYARCDYHRNTIHERAVSLWEFKQTLINPETQALCYVCSDVFTPDQMIQKYYNIRGQFTKEVRVKLCPEHYLCERNQSQLKYERTRKALVKEMLDQLELQAAGKVGCANEHCQLNRTELRKLLVKRHGEDIGVRLFASSFDCDHEPRRVDRVRVSYILNPLLRATERARTQPLCCTTCHRHKTWSGFEWLPYFTSTESEGRRCTRQQVTAYMDMKLRRFDGEDPSRPHECGCQGYVDNEGVQHKCPFQESLEKIKEVFCSTNRLGRNTGIDDKYGFLTMYTFDHDELEKKTLEFSEGRNMNSTEAILRLSEEMDGATMRCHACHRFKGILCGDSRASEYVPRNATALITGDNMQDPALIITVDDDFSDLV